VRDFKPGDRVHVPGLGAGRVIMGGVCPPGATYVELDGGITCWAFAKDLSLLEEKTMNQVKDDDVVTATAGRIRSAAGKCPQANQVLREVYPEVFKEKIESEWMLGDIVRCLVKIDGYLDTINKTGIVVKVNADRRRIHVQFVWDVAGTSDQNGVWGTHDDFTLIRRPNLNCTPKS
jgi:hypothetical protein